ncbi:hypothetical protein M758_1G200100 [Ceratodon purpureus]|nr:hypothetical protein M758_1G200100 [Ceratodon purpureus]
MGTSTLCKQGISIYTKACTAEIITNSIVHQRFTSKLRMEDARAIKSGWNERVFSICGNVSPILLARP